MKLLILLENASIGIAIAALTILIAIALRKDIIVRKQKFLYLFIVIVLVFSLLPFTLNALITVGALNFFSEYSVFSSDIWFSFIGSYAGVLGTVIVGWVAFKQTEIIREQDASREEQQKQQNEMFQQLQNIVAAYQIKPNLTFYKMSWLACEGSSNIFSVRSMVEHYLFMQYGITEKLGNDDRFVIIKLQYSSNGLVPLEQIEIESIDWEIYDTSFRIECTGIKRSVRPSEELYIIIEPRDVTNNRFFEVLSEHADFSRYGKYGYDKSELKISLKTRNSVGCNRYKLHFRIDTDESRIEYDKSGLFIECNAPYVTIENVE